MKNSRDSLQRGKVSFKIVQNVGVFNYLWHLEHRDDLFGALEIFLGSFEELHHSKLVDYCNYYELKVHKNILDFYHNVKETIVVFHQKTS